MTVFAKNLYADIPEQLPEELMQCLAKKNTIRIERIISKGHITPADQWYDQSEDEWVILLRGQATLLFENNRELVSLNPGDYLLIPAHTRHRVEWTPPEIHTFWLAVHF